MSICVICGQFFCFHLLPFLYFAIPLLTHQGSVNVHFGGETPVEYAKKTRIHPIKINMLAGGRLLIIRFFLFIMKVLR